MFDPNFVQSNLFYGYGGSTRYRYDKVRPLHNHDNYLTLEVERGNSLGVTEKVLNSIYNTKSCNPT